VVCAIGGSAMPAARLKQFTALTGIVAVNIYGQTEQSGLSITEPIDEERRPGSLGKPLDQVVRWQLVPVGADADTPEPLPARCGEIGELWVRGDAVTPGYWQLPEANAAKFTAVPADGRGAPPPTRSTARHCAHASTEGVCPVYRWCMSRTNIDIDDELIAEAMRKYHLRTKKEAVDLALRRLVGPRLSPEFLARLEGSGWDGDLDELRAGSSPQDYLY
jgi:Arc/MetJ family transcription regulator